MLLIAGAFLVSSADTALGQLLFRSGLEQEFYGRTGYNKYGRSIVNRSANPKYDEFGNYIMDGVRIFEWNEEKRSSRSTTEDDRFSQLYKTNNIDEGEYFRQYLNNLVVVNESTKSFSSRFIVGNEIRANFSSLTLDMAALNGVRWDTNFGNNNISFVSSRSDLPLWFPRELVNQQVRERLLPVYLTAGHFERQFGILNVAANYVNQYKSDSAQARRYTSQSIFSDVRDSATGSVPSKPELVQMLVVKVEDGSRFDAGGPQIHDMYAIVEGVPRKDLLVGITRENWKNDFYAVRKQNNNPAKDFYENVWMLDPRRIPQYYDFASRRIQGAATNPSNYLLLRKNTSETSTIPSDFGALSGDNKKYLECSGEDYLLFWFEIPKKTGKDDAGKDIDIAVENVEFSALIGNDYKISISEVYSNVYASSYGNQSARYFKVVREAPGNVKDMSNLGWVNFHYGMQTADMIMGVRVSSHIKGFSMVAEFNKNYNFHQYPNANAKKFHDNAEAYYINVKKEFGKFALGTELFNIDPNYSTSFENMDMSYFFMNTIPYSSWVDEFLSDVSGRGGSEGKVASTANEYLNNTMVINSVDDNDDKDRYPDYHTYSAVRDMNGIYPGLDANGNQRPDTNENENLVPDYAEPFFLYNVDPDEYSFGDDFNNNHVIDNREDDDKPDYPYNLDTRGYHLFGSWGADQGIKYTLGVINYNQIAGGGKNDVRYGKLEYQKFIPFFANVNFASVFKKAEDSINDNVFRFARELSSTLRDSSSYTYNVFYHNHGVIPERYYDPLEYRDSYVSTSYFETKLFRIPNLTIGLKFKYDWNQQNENSYQQKNTIIDRSQVLRADYRYYFHDLLIMPQVKFMARKYTNGNNVEPTLHEQYFYPILRAEYPLTYNTTLKFGAQGFPGIRSNGKTIIPAVNSTVRNLVNDQLDYDTRDYILMVTNRSMYNGYDFSLNFGYQVNWQDLKGEVRAPLSRSNKVLFIRLIVGMEPVS
ncbi:MAG: hypothetical protein ACYC9O_10325 [Candidatus Latescibacterota bacterium]